MRAHRYVSTETTIGFLDCSERTVWAMVAAADCGVCPHCKARLLVREMPDASGGTIVVTSTKHDGACTRGGDRDPDPLGTAEDLLRSTPEDDTLFTEYFDPRTPPALAMASAFVLNSLYLE